MNENIAKTIRTAVRDSETVGFSTVSLLMELPDTAGDVRTLRLVIEGDVKDGRNFVVRDLSEVIAAEIIRRLRAALPSR